jgi:hypothetical protein
VEESVDHAVEAAEVDLDLGCSQALGVPLAIVTQGIELGRQDRGRRNPGQIVVEEW